MTLRRRLMLIIGLSFAVLWGASTAWMFHDMRTQFRATLDQRLTASAQMVASLIVQLPSNAGAPDSPRSLLDMAGRDGIACEVRSRSGQLEARTGNAPSGLQESGPGFATRVLDGERWRIYTMEREGKRITTADRVETRLALLRRILFSQFVPFAVAWAGGLLVLWLAIRRALQPLEDVRQALASRAPDSLSPLAVNRTPPELTPLVSTINRLLERTGAAMERERRFTGDAAHELRTPLTAVKTHIQVALMTVQDAATRASLEQAQTGTQRLQHTLAQLLTLARLEEASSFQDDELDSALAIAKSALAEVPPSQQHRVQLDSLADEATAALPRILLLTALRNLLDNALRYSPAGETVTLRLEALDGGIRFSVLDRGPGMSEADRADALRRFWRKGQGEGSGLGLSIVDVIAQRLGGAFALERRRDGGMIASLAIPNSMPPDLMPPDLMPH